MDSELKKILDDHEKRIAFLEGMPKSNIQNGNKQTSLKEFLISKQPKDDVQRTLLIAYFLEKDKGLDSFNVKDIEEGFRISKESVPKNVSDKTYKCVKAGLMMDAGTKKDKLSAWVLTNTGERLIENGFNTDQ